MPAQAVTLPRKTIALLFAAIGAVSLAGAAAALPRSASTHAAIVPAPATLAQ